MMRCDTALDSRTRLHLAAMVLGLAAAGGCSHLHAAVACDDRFAISTVSRTFDGIGVEVVSMKSRTVTIGEAAHVTGSISGDTVRVCGSVNGQIRGQTVTLDKTAKVNGDIHHQSLAIEPGAFLEGHCRRIDSKPASVASVSSSASSSSSLGSSASTAPSLL